MINVFFLVTHRDVKKQPASKVSRKNFSQKGDLRGWQFFVYFDGFSCEVQPPF